MHEVYFFKKFIVKDATGSPGPSEDTIYWGEKFDCEVLAKKLNETLQIHEDFVEKDITGGWMLEDGTCETGRIMKKAHDPKGKFINN